MANVKLFGFAHHEQTLSPLIATAKAYHKELVRAPARPAPSARLCFRRRPSDSPTSPLRPAQVSLLRRMTGGSASHIRRSVSVSENEPGPAYVPSTLHIAEEAEGKNVEAARRGFLALDKSARPEVLDQLMHLACRRGIVPLMELCLEWGAPPDARDAVTGNTVYHIAASAGHAHILKLLMKHQSAEAIKEQLAMPNADGRTPLLLATRYGHVSVVEALCAAGADPNISLPTFAPPLFAAIENRHAACALALLDAGADPNCIDRNALSCAWWWLGEEGKGGRGQKRGGEARGRSAEDGMNQSTHNPGPNNTPTPTFPQTQLLRRCCLPASDASHP